MLRGATDDSPHLATLLACARSAGFAQIVVRTNALAHARAQKASALALAGAEGVLVPLFSHLDRLHDAVTGLPGSLRSALRGIASLASAGLAVEIEIPLLSQQVQRLVPLLGLAHGSVPELRAARFYLPEAAMPVPLSPPPWSDAAGELAGAIGWCRTHGVRVAIRHGDAIPLCALRDFPDLHDSFAFDPRSSLPPADGCRSEAVCQGCAAKEQCPGVAVAYSVRHGTAGLAPYARRPAGMYAQRTTPPRRWTAEERASAARAEVLVLRPTLDCNQDCVFCSANETSGNAWSARRGMYRAISRAARRGVARVSFSGGEPTLSPDLVRYVRVAHRCGIGAIEVVTNGVLLEAPARVRALRQAGLTDAFVSLHAHCEEVSRHLTRKAGDFGRTVRAIHGLLDEGIPTVVNHVVNARNHPFLRSFVEFLQGQFGGGVPISFAFVTPQHKGLESLDLMPRISEMWPNMRSALHRAVELGQPFLVGSRQGVPPCLLGEFRAWSDVLGIARAAQAEDGHQKIRVPGCDRCRYTRFCTGVWRPYAARHGTDELRPILGPAFEDRDLPGLTGMGGGHPQFGLRSFDSIPEPLRDRGAEREWVERGAAATDSQAEAIPGAEAPGLRRTRPLRLVFLGSGRQARRLALALKGVAEVSLVAVASPHAPESDRSEFGDCPVYRDSAEALDELRPDGTVIASTTETHYELTRLAVERGIPALVEKPFTRTESEARDLAALVAGGALVMPAHNAVFSPGLDGLWEHDGWALLRYLRRWEPTAAEAPRGWSRQGLHETLYHVLSVVRNVLPVGPAHVESASWAGESRPWRVRFRLRFDRAEAEVDLDFDSPGDEWALTTSRDGSDAPLASWLRRGRSVWLSVGDRTEQRSAEGSDLERMLAAFRDVVLGRRGLPVTIEEAVRVLVDVQAILGALSSGGAPFDRPAALRRASSPGLRRS